MCYPFTNSTFRPSDRISLTSTLKDFRDSRLEIVFAAHDRFVDLGAARHVVRLHGEDFLQRVGGAIGLERPHFHFAEALAAELRLAAQAAAA